MGSKTKFTSGCQSIDGILGGGFNSGQVTQVYGESGVGKSNLVAATSIEAAASGDVVFAITKDSTTFDRMRDIAEEHPEPTKEIIDRVWFDSLDNFEEQNSRIDDIDEFGDLIDIVVFDGFGGHYRMERAKEDTDSTKVERRLARQVTLLKAIARKYNIPIIVTNQVYYSPDEEKVKPLGGAGLNHWFDAILQMESFQGNKHLVLVEKHRDEKEGEQAWFGIENNGLISYTP